MFKNTLMVFAVFAVLVGLVFSADGQTRKKRKATQPVTSVPTTTEPQIVSRAADVSDNEPITEPTPVPEITPAAASANVADLENRIRMLESVNSKDADAKQKRLLLNLDILTRAEQRSETLRKQIFDLLEKESDIRAKMDRVEYELRPEAIDRNIAFAGSLRPEELRATRRKSLESEKANLQILVNEITKTRANLEATLLRSDALVEKLRTKLEKEIDLALDDDPQKP
jgi:hypothetical protein